MEQKIKHRLDYSGSEAQKIFTDSLWPKDPLSTKRQFIEKKTKSHPLLCNVGLGQ